MNQKLKILLVADEVWNDKIYPNNVLSNWFEGFNAEFAQIYCSPGIPCNKCCRKYLQLTDAMMLKSIFKGERAGRVFEIGNNVQSTGESLPENEDNKKLYSFMKSIASESVRAIRDWIWLAGKYDEEKMCTFISEFNPDIVFCPRFATRKMLRLERKVAEISGKPMVAFTGDDEYSLKQLNFSPIYWVRRFLLRKDIRKTMSTYNKYYTLSLEQLQEYKSSFNIDIDLLRKCANFNEKQIKKNVGHPIKMLYAGKLYCNRWKTLVAVGKALKTINKGGKKIILDVYTKDKVNRKKYSMLHDNENIFLKGSVSADKLKTIYKNTDITLHVESFDLKNRMLTRLSFSTKIIDCFASGCAVMAICWEKHSGYTYLKREDAAFTISNNKNILPTLKSIINNPNSILDYAKKAWECGKRNHQIDVIQNSLYKDLKDLANKHKNENLTD